ncbi:MAG TPA: SPFH domain-containing protein [Bacteroidales bacterium]|nr:SPFH domain-containing protein [Bacteroidales bacterium]
MGIFSNKQEGGLMDVIRCDEQEYLVWKWRPSGEPNSTKKENAIRYGSSLRVKDGEMAVFFYQQNNGAIQDFIIGPHDQTIKTANFPVLTSIVGAAFGGNSPFQAEIYFINLSGNVQIKFGIPYFDVFDPRFPDLGVPCAVRGTMIFNITDYKNFIKLNRLINFSLEDFKNQVKDFFIRQAKSVVLNITSETGVPAMQLETKIDLISTYLKSKLSESLADDFGVNLKRIDIGTIELDKEHPHYQQLKKSTVDQQTKFIDAKTDIEIKNLDEMMRIQRKEAELGVEGKNINVHQLNIQGDVAKTAAESLGELGGAGTGGDGSGINPAGMMAGMMMGGAVGSGMAGMMGNMMHGVNQPVQSPPPPPNSQYFIALNGQQSGPYSLLQLQQMVQNGSLTKNHHVWKQGMSEWLLATDEQEIAKLFSSVPPPPPNK